MIVNGKKFDIDDLIKTIDVNKNSFKNVGNIILTNSEIEILDKYLIDYKSAKNLRDLMLKIEHYLDETGDIFELESVINSLSEREYYYDIKK